MWVYEIRTGRFISDNPDQGTDLLTIGYSGHERGKNNPMLQREAGIGPIPVGMYHIGEVYDSDEHGPRVMRLEPYAKFQVYGRDGFLIHGDSVQHPGGASHGCVILSRPVRERVANSPDRLLVVITGGI